MHWLAILPLAVALPTGMGTLWHLSRPGGAFERWAADEIEN